jgi:MFS family permease
MSTTAIPNVLRKDATIVSLVGFAHATSHFFHFMLPPLFPWFIREYGLSYTQVGVLMSIFFVVSGIGQAMAGFLVDRWGAHRVLCLGVALLSLSGILVAASIGLWGLYLAAFVAGLGNCVFHPADFALLNHRVSPSRLGHAFSMHGLSGNIGWALGPLVMTSTATLFNWRAAGLAAAVVGGASLTTLWWKRAELSDALDQPSSGGDASRNRPRVGLRTLLGLRLTWIAFCFLFFATLVFGALNTYATPLLQNLYGFSLALATSGLTAYLLGGAGGLIAGGFLASNIPNQEKIAAASYLGAAVMAFLLAFTRPPGWAVIGAMAAIGFGVGLVAPSRDMLVRKAAAARLGSGAFGRVYGLVYSGADAGAALAPIPFGLLMDAGAPRFVFAGLSLALVIAVIAAQAVAGEGR